MKRLLSVLAAWLLATVALGHDLKLVSIVIDASKGTVSSVLPLSRLIAADNLTDNFTLLEVDLDVRHRLNVGSIHDSHVKLDYENDMILWEGSGVSPTWKPAAFYPEDSASRTLVTFVKGDTVVSRYVIGGTASVSAPVAALGFLKVGVEHILTGADHILFVLGLVFLGRAWSQTLKIITAFTVAHSITLALAVLHVMHPNPRIVEPLIALSIVAVAIENLRPHPENKMDLSLFIAFGFGLVHGFGFADALQHIGLTGWDLGLCLVTFNVGVEIGQASILAVGLGLVALLRKKAEDNAGKILAAGSTIVGMVGAYWFVTRLFGA